jgi:hypothetical protein
MKSVRHAIVLALVAAAGGCAGVEPWQRGYLARPDMATGAGVGAGRILDKAYAAKEAASGGDAVGGGGCGCN